MASAGQWLFEALVDLSSRLKTGLELDSDLISSLVAHCDRASPLDAKEYLDNIIGRDAGKQVIDEYMRMRGHSGRTDGQDLRPTAGFQAYMKPAVDDRPQGAKRRPKPERGVSRPVGPTREGDPDNRRGAGKKKPGRRMVSLWEAARGGIVFRKGERCSCQARRHDLVSNCLSCGKVVCRQEGEGPCGFCGTLVVRDATAYSGLDETAPRPSDAQVAAEAFTKRLVGYDRDSAARTAVIDDQSDYYEVDGNTWLSAQEKELLRKKADEMREAERARRRQVVVSFDVFGRKVMVGEGGEGDDDDNKGLVSKMEEVKVSNRIRPNPNLQVRPVFVGREYSSREKGKVRWGPDSGLSLAITGRVQGDESDCSPHP